MDRGLPLVTEWGIRPEQAKFYLYLELVRLGVTDKIKCGSRSSPLEEIPQIATKVTSTDPTEPTTAKETWEFSDPINTWFELTYAQYLTVPRSILQAMPVEWQRRFAMCLCELDDSIDWRPEQGRYWVSLRDGKGRYQKDPLHNYRHPPNIEVKGEDSGD